MTAPPPSSAELIEIRKRIESASSDLGSRILPSENDLIAFFGDVWRLLDLAEAEESCEHCACLLLPHR